MTVWTNDETGGDVWSDDEGLATVSSVRAELLATYAAQGGSSLVGFVQSGTGAVARTVQSKEREIVSVTDFYANGVSGAAVVGDGVTDCTLGIQAALDALDDGGTLYFPLAAVDYKFSTLTVDKSVTLKGAGWQVRANQVFGHADWANTTYQQGSILRSTATSGNALTCTTAGETLPYNLKDLAIIGPGSGTSVGVALGSSGQSSVASHWQNVMVANFATGYKFNGVIDCTFVSVRARGNTTGFSFENCYQNCFVNNEAQNATDAFQCISGAQNDFFGGLLQNNTDGLSVKPNVAGAIEAFNFYGTWFENNTNNIHLDTTDGAITGLLFQATRMGGGTAIAYTAADTINFPKFIGNQWSGLAVTLASNVSNAVWSANNAGTLTDNAVKTQIDATPASYTPSLTNFTATINAATYCRVGNMVFVQVQLTLTVGAPSGTIAVSLPVAATNSVANLPQGTALAVDIGTAYYQGVPYLASSTTVSVHAPSSGNEWNGTVPHAWAVGDQVQLNLAYFA